MLRAKRSSGCSKRIFPTLRTRSEPRLRTSWCLGALPRALGALSHDEAIREMLATATGARTVTVLQAVFARLHSIQAIIAAGIGIQANLDIGRVTPTEIVNFVSDQISGSRR